MHYAFTINSESGPELFYTGSLKCIAFLGMANVPSGFTMRPTVDPLLAHLATQTRLANAV